MRIFYIVFIVLGCISCTSQKKVAVVSGSQHNVLDSLLRSTQFDSLLQPKDRLNLQVIYTRIDRDANNVPSFTDYYFNVDANKYFYPASTVKMPASFLALEKLNKLNVPALNKKSIMITDSAFSRQQAVYNNFLSADGAPTVAEYIKEIFLVSDNDAFNRLYEFLGQEYFNEQLRRKGFSSAEIIHRLNIFLTEEQNRTTNPVSFYDTSCNPLWQQPLVRSGLQYSGKNARIGDGYYAGSKLVHEPFDFSKKNRLSLQDLHQLLRTVVFPETVPEKQRFQLTETDYKFLYKYMSAYPSEITFPGYDTALYENAGGKFLLVGSGKKQPPSNIRIFNKIGEAYGFLTDVAYIIDFESKVEFMLSATILCNRDGIFNDDTYDYNSLGFPFMKKLGELVYEHEKQRVKKHLPELSKFVIDYSAAD